MTTAAGKAKPTEAQNLKSSEKLTHTRYCLYYSDDIVEKGSIIKRTLENPIVDSGNLLKEEVFFTPNLGRNSQAIPKAEPQTHKAPNIPRLKADSI